MPLKRTIRRVGYAISMSYPFRTTRHQYFPPLRLIKRLWRSQTTSPSILSKKRPSSSKRRARPFLLIKSLNNSKIFSLVTGSALSARNRSSPLEALCVVLRLFHPPADPLLQAVLTNLQNIARLLHIFCADCQLNHCRGCMSPVQCVSSCGKVDECDAVKCCPRVRVLAIFEILAILDFHHLHELSNTQKRVSSAMTRASKKKSSAVGPGGTGYANGELQFDEFNGYDDNMTFNGQYGLNFDGWANPGCERGQSTFSPEPASPTPWGSGWDASVDADSSFKQKAMKNPKTSQRATKATGSKTESGVTSDGTHNSDDVSIWVFHALMVYLPNPTPTRQPHSTSFHTPRFVHYYNYLTFPRLSGRSLEMTLSPTGLPGARHTRPCYDYYDDWPTANSQSGCYSPRGGPRL